MMVHFAPRTNSGDEDEENDRDDRDDDSNNGINYNKG